MILWAVLGALVFFLVAAAIAVLWARGQVGKQQQTSQRHEDRARLLPMAAHAATDESGKHLLLLLGALEGEGPDCPVRVEWIARAAHAGQPEGMLVKITWDGNEWRRIMPREAFKDRVALLMAEDPACASARARELLAALETP